MRFIIFLTYSSYIEAYEVQKINNKVLRQGANITIVGFPKLRKQRSQLLRLCQQQRPVTKAGHTNLKIKRKKRRMKKRQTTAAGAPYGKKKHKKGEGWGAIIVVCAELISGCRMIGNSPGRSGEITVMIYIDYSGGLFS